MLYDLEEAHETVDSDSDDLPRLPESFFRTHSSTSLRFDFIILISFFILFLEVMIMMTLL